MSLTLKVSDATFTKYVSSLPPYLSICKAFLLPGTSEALSLRNYANSAAPASVIGTPTYGAGYANCSSHDNGFSVPAVVNASPFTHIVVAANTTSGICGNWVQAGPTNNLLFHASTDVAIGIDGSAKSRTPMTGTPAYRFIAGSDSGTVAKVYCHDGSSLVAGDPVTHTAASGTTSAFKVGGSGFSTTTPFQVAAAMTFQQVLTSAQILEIYTYLKALLATRGIAVV